MTVFRNLVFDLPIPQSPTPGVWPRRLIENSVEYFLYLSFVLSHTKFDFTIFEIDFVIKIIWYLTFVSLPKALGGVDHSCD